MTGNEINRIILETVEEADVDVELKRFVKEILNLERQYWNQENVRYTKDYEELIAEHARTREG